MIFRVWQVTLFGEGREDWVEVSLQRDRDEVSKEIDFKIPWPAAAKPNVGDTFLLQHVPREPVVDPAVAA